MVCMNVANLVSIGDCTTKLVVNISNTKISIISNETNTNMMQSASSRTIVVQNQDTTIVNAPPGYDINIAQTSNIKFESNTNMVQQNQVQVMNKLASEINNAVKQKMEQTLGVLAVGSPAMNSYTNFSNKVIELVNNTQNINAITENVNDLLNLQSQKIVITWTPSTTKQNEILNSTIIQNNKINITQESYVLMYVTTVIDQTIDILNENESLVTYANDIAQEIKQEVRGIDTITGQIVDFLKTYGLIFLGVIVAFIIGAVAIWYFFLANPENVKTITAAGLEGAKLAKGGGI